MRSIILVTALMTALCAQPNRADAQMRLLTEQLIEKCRGEGEARAECRGYLAGVIEFQATLQMMGQDDPLFCPPRTATAEAAREAVVAWADEAPDQLPGPASLGVLSALQSIYSCH